MKMMIRSTSDGWVTVKMDSGKEEPLPEYCSVEQTGTKRGRDLFVIAEGPLAHQPASLPKGYLIRELHEAAAEIQFYRKSSILSWKGGPKVSYDASGNVVGGIPTFTDSSNMVPAGIWDVEIPDAPHRWGRKYQKHAPHTFSWFRQATTRAKDRYLHVGTASAGCTTVGIEGDMSSPDGIQALKNFETLYAYLIRKRSAPGIVGKINVFDY